MRARDGERVQESSCYLQGIDVSDDVVVQLERGAALDKEQAERPLGRKVRRGRGETVTRELARKSRHTFRETSSWISTSATAFRKYWTFT